MPTDILYYSPLKRIVSFALDEMNKSDKDFDKAWLFAFRGLLDIGYDMSFLPKSVRIPKNANQTVTLPSDYIGWSKIGILNNNGEVSTLKINNALSIYKDNNPNRLSDLTADVSDAIPSLLGAPYFFNWYDNGVYYNLFGVGGGLIQYGECRVDEQNKLIVLSPNFRYDSVILEYLSSPQLDGDYQIETVLQEALIAFIKWKFRMGTDQEYYAELIKGRRRLPNKRVTLQNFNDVIRQATGMYLKA